MLPDTPVDMICGSRIKMAGRKIERSLFRHIQGRAFATAVDKLFHLGLYDTQCGLKFSRRACAAIAADAAGRSLAARCGCSRDCSTPAASEVPVDCYQHGASSSVFGVDSVKMLSARRLRQRLREWIVGRLDAAAGPDTPPLLGLM
jgi:dolichyl-phosphate beta-glucosyltransferase